MDEPGITTIPLNNGNVGTIYYTADYYELEGIVNPTNPEYAPYTAEEIVAIKDGAVEARRATALMLLPLL